MKKHRKVGREQMIDFIVKRVIKRRMYDWDKDAAVRWLWKNLLVLDRMTIEKIYLKLLAEEL